MVNVLLILVYISCSWFIPWPTLELGFTLNTSYLFDIVFLLFASFVIKSKPQFNKKFNPLYLVLNLFWFAIVAILLNKLQIPSPFHLIPGIFILMVFVGPIIEEFIYRYMFHEILKKTPIQSKGRILLTSLLFSLSHFYIYFFIPAEFKPFIIFQTGYTFVMGLIYGFEYEKNENMVSVLTHHFIFNALFYYLLVGH